MEQLGAHPVLQGVQGGQGGQGVHLVAPVVPRFQARDLVALVVCLREHTHHQGQDTLGNQVIAHQVQV